jgi:dephospho-CoA kinase
VIGNDEKTRGSPQEPLVVFVIGVAGCGKSTVAKALARQLAAVYLDKDTVVTRFTEELLSHAGCSPGDRESEFYRQHVMPLEYQTLLDIGSENIRQGMPVVFDAPFGAYFNDAEYVTRAARQGFWPEGRRVVLHVTVDKERNRQQLLARGLSRDVRKLERWDEFWASQQQMHCRWSAVEHFRLENPDDAAVTQLADRLLGRCRSTTSAGTATGQISRQ